MRTLILLLLAMSPAVPMAAAAQAGQKSKPTAVSASDADLERRIRAKFSRSKIAAEGFRVRVENGVAIVEGKTSVIQRKGTATRLARLAGAKGVKNLVEISDEARAKAAGNLAEGRRRAQVRRGEPRDGGRAEK